MNWRRYIPLLIVVAGAIAYHNSFQGVFVFDDGHSIVENHRIQKLWPPWAALADATRPLVQLSLAVNYAFGKLNPWGYHLFNLIVHLLAGLTLYGVLRRTLGRFATDRRPETGDRRPTERASELQNARAIEDDRRPMTDDQSDRGQMSERQTDGGTRSVASSVDSNISDQPGETPRPLRSVALQSSVVSHPSSVVSPAHAAVLAGVIALIWVVHPLNTQAVTYIIQRGESMMGLFYLLTLYCFIRAVDGSEALTSDQCSSGRLVHSPQSPVSGLHSLAPARLARWVSVKRTCLSSIPWTRVRSPVSGLLRRRSLWLAASVAACSAGMLCKEVMATAPLMVLAYDRLFVGGSFLKALRQRWPFYAGLFATWGMIAWLVMSGDEPGHSAGFTMSSLTSRDYALTQPSVILHYLRLAIWPVGLCFDYLWPIAQGFWQIVPPLLLVSGMVALTLYLFYRSSALAFPGLWFFGILSITSSIMPIADLAVEHRMYLPLIAPIVLVVVGCHGLLRWGGGHRSAMIGLIGASGVVVALTVVTIERNKVYHDENALLADVLRNRPMNFRAHVTMASLARKQKRNDIAKFHYRKVIDLIQYNRDHFQASRFLGTAQFYLGDYQQAYVNLSEAVKIATRPADLWNMLGLIALRQGEPSKASDCFAKATISSPSILEYWFNLGLALTRENRFSDAEAAFRQALHVDVMDAPSHHGLAMALWNQGKGLDAVASWRDATTRDPKFWPSVYNLAWALATHPDPLVRNGPESLQLARRIVDNMKKPDALALGVLAAALAECGRFEKAIQVQERSLSMPFDDGGTIVTGTDREQRLELYRQGKSWRMTTTNPQQSHTN